MLWLNGGPGASTISSGLLFENGPCRYSVEENTTVWNEYGWNEKVNIIYLDQPVGTGFSYGGAESTTLANLATDVYTFLQLWMARFPEYARLPLHVAGESWGGHYVPHIAHYINTQNELLAQTPSSSRLPLNLASINASWFLSLPLYQNCTISNPTLASNSFHCVSVLSIPFSNANILISSKLGWRAAPTSGRTYSKIRSLE